MNPLLLTVSPYIYMRYSRTGDPQFVENINVESHLNISNAGDGRRAIGFQ